MNVLRRRRRASLLHLKKITTNMVKRELEKRDWLAGRWVRGYGDGPDRRGKCLKQVVTVETG